MSVLDASGDKIGKVQQVIANGQGQVQSLLVKVDGAKAMLPAGNFQAAGSGNALVSAMGEGAIKQTAQQQDNSGQ
jgi:sporulation protein YlmC with PRC-barrel domain